MYIKYSLFCRITALWTKITFHTYVGLLFAETDLGSEEVYDIISKPQTPIAFAITCTEKNPKNNNFSEISSNDFFKSDANHVINV